MFPVGKGIQELLDDLSNPLWDNVADFFSKNDICTTIALYQIELSSRVAKIGTIDLDTTVGALFEDSTDEDWGSIETRWADILRKGKKEIDEILDRREKIIVSVLGKKVSDEKEIEYEALGLEIGTTTSKLVQKMSSDIDSIIEGIKTITT